MKNKNIISKRWSIFLAEYSRTIFNAIEKLWGEAYYLPQQFALWRILFGLYVLYYLVRTLPYATELYSREGVLPDPTINWVYGYFPNILYIFDSPFFIQLFIIVLIVSAIFVTVGYFRRASALILWYGWAALLGKNVLTMDPSLPFIGWLLLACVIIPIGEPFSLRIFTKTPKKQWYMPASVYWGAWLILGASFTVSGIDKLEGPSWQNGLAMMHLYNKTMVYDWWLPRLITSLPLWTVKLQTWASVAIYIISLPMIFSRYTRPMIWILWCGMFLWTLLFFDLVQVILGMFLFYFFLFNSRWLSKKLTPMCTVKNLNSSQNKLHSGP